MKKFLVRAVRQTIGKIIWKIDAVNGIKTTYRFLGGRLSFGKLFSSVKENQYSLTVQNLFIGLKPFGIKHYRKLKRKGIFIQVYFWRWWITFTTNKETIEKKQLFLFNFKG